MGKRKSVILLIIVLFFISNFTYFTIKYNTVTDLYDFVTLRNLHSTINNILGYYIDEVDNDEVLYNYFRKMYEHAWYFNLSPRLHSIDIYVEDLSDIIDDGVSEEEKEHLAKTHDELKIFINKINDKISNKFRIQSLFNKANINELKDILSKPENLK